MQIPDEVLNNVASFSVRCPACGAEEGLRCGARENPFVLTAHPTRYIAARDQAVALWARKEALREAAAAHFEQSVSAGLGDPTAVAEWLRARADAAVTD